MRSSLAIRHVHFEDLGILGYVLEEQEYSIKYADAGVDSLAEIDPLEHDIVVILGGPMSAYEQDQYPFLADEIRIIQARLAARRPIMGICLGAQLMAMAMGARVYPAKKKELGWGPLTLTYEGRRYSPLRYLLQGALGPGGLDHDVPVLHWHGDTFDLPEGTDLLASTEICENQAFCIGRWAYGVQFHIELKKAHVERWLIGHAHELRQLYPEVSVAQLRADCYKWIPKLSFPAASIYRSWVCGAHIL